jgi:hypothetical protein
MPDEALREIIREHEFEEQLERLLVNMEEVDDFTLGAEFVLAREPRDGVPASEDGSIWASHVPDKRETGDVVLYLR